MKKQINNQTTVSACSSNQSESHMVYRPKLQSVQYTNNATAFYFRRTLLTLCAAVLIVLPISCGNGGGGGGGGSGGSAVTPTDYKNFANLSFRYSNKEISNLVKQNVYFTENILPQEKMEINRKR